MHPRSPHDLDAPRDRRATTARGGRKARNVALPAAGLVVVGLAGGCTYPEPGTPAARALELLGQHDQQGDGVVDSEDVINLLDTRFSVPADEIDDLLAALAEFVDIELPEELPAPSIPEAPTEPVPDPAMPTEPVPDPAMPTEPVPDPAMPDDEAPAPTDPADPTMPDDDAPADPTMPDDEAPADPAMLDDPTGPVAETPAPPAPGESPGDDLPAEDPPAAPAGDEAAPPADDPPLDIALDVDDDEALPTAPADDGAGGSEPKVADDDLDANGRGDGKADDISCNPTPAPAPAPAPAPSPVEPAPAPAPAPPPAPPATGGGVAVGTVQLSADEQLLFNLVNDLRASLGLPALQPDPQLLASARAQAATMNATGVVEHQDLMPILVEGNGRWRLAAENIALHNGIVEAHDALVASPGHYRNLTNPNLTHLGVGIVRAANGQVYVAQVFAG
jgi:uncharacterized protein YkwD